MDKKELEEFFLSMEKDENTCCHSKDKWWVVFQSELPFYDFNREIFCPGTVDDLANGGLGVRVDEDFYLVALLPYKFTALSIQDIVSVLWPEIDDPKFNQDSIAKQKD